MGRPSSDILTPDHDANGKGWFLDPTPWENSEFEIQTYETSFQAQPNSEASDKYALLTTNLHELAHLNGIINGNPAFDQFVQGDGTNLHFVAPGINAQLTPDGSHLDATAHPNRLINTTLRLGQHKLPDRPIPSNSDRNISSRHNSLFKQRLINLSKNYHEIYCDRIPSD